MSPVEVISTAGPEVEVISAVGPDIVATTTVVPPQAIANVLLSGPPGPRGPAGTLAGYVTPQQFGAIGDGVADDTAAVQAAIAAAGTTNTIGHGGVVYYPPGTYNCSAALTYWPCTMWVGAGASASIIKLTTDLWAGGTNQKARFIVPGAGVGQTRNFKMANLRIIGPGPGAAPGVVPSHTNGVRSASGLILDNVFIGGGFFAGLEITADHEKMVNLYSTGNYYNVDYSDAKATSGNQVFFSCILTGCGLAGIHVGGNNTIEGSSFQQLHLGFGPVGVLMTDQQNGWDASGNPVYAGGVFQNGHRILNTTFSDVVFEQVGNIAILDMCSTSGPANLSLGAGTVIRGEGVIWQSTAGSYYTTNAPLNNPDYQRAWAVFLRGNHTTARIEFGYYPLAAAPTGASGVYKAAILNSTTPFISFPAVVPANFFGAGATWSPLVGMFGRFSVNVTSQLVNGGQWGDVIAVNSTAAAVIAVGDCVELIAGNSVQRATGTKPVFGIAKTPAPGTQQVTILIQTNGYCPINSTVSGVAAGSALYLDATTTYQVNNTNTAGKVVAMAMSSVGSGVINSQLRFGFP